MREALVTSRLLTRQRVLGTVVLVAAAVLWGCTSGGGGGDEDGTPLDQPRPLDASLVALGGPIYAANCATCHGANGEGEPNWKQPRDDGTLPAPPHDETGHTWHHADGLLFRIIRDGCAAYGGSTPCRMPAFGGALSDKDIVAVIEYLRTWWGPEDRAFQQQVTANDPFPDGLR